MAYSRSIALTYTYSSTYDQNHPSCIDTTSSAIASLTLAPVLVYNLTFHTFLPSSIKWVPFAAQDHRCIHILPTPKAKASGKLYHLESRWRNSHVLVYHGPLPSHLWGVAPSTFTMAYVRWHVEWPNLLHQKGKQSPYHTKHEATFVWQMQMSHKKTGCLVGILMMVLL